MMQPRTAQQFNGLQVLRFVAAMLVVAMHITQAISIHVTGRGGSHYWSAGSAGVDIFFVISGFVMAVSTSGLPREGAARYSAAWVFMKRRLLRIAPLYWFYTLLKAALLLAVPALAVTSSIAPGHLAASLLFVPATSPWGTVQPTLPVGWTLNFEMLFYALFAVAIALGRNRILVCLLTFGSIFLAQRYLPEAVPLAFYAQTIIFEFLLGVAIAHLLARMPAAPVPVAALLVLGGVLFMFGPAWGAQADRFLTWGLGAAAIVLGVAWLEPLIARAPLVHPLSFLGDASYSIYLSHTFVVPAGVLVLHRLGVQDGFAIALAVALAVVAAGCLSHIWIEKPLISFFKRLLFRPAPAHYPYAANTPVK